MIYQNVEFSNTAETTTDNGGVALQRVPESVRAHLNEGAQLKVMQPGSGEIRFALDPSATDLIHPADDGMVEMGCNLAAVLKGLLVTAKSA